MSKALAEISRLGTSIWLDDLSRERLIAGGTARSLRSLIDSEFVVGVTTNPAIFSTAISNSPLYQDEIRSLHRAGTDTEEIITTLTCADVMSACDLFAGVYERSGGSDGRVSIEVDPRFARDADSTIRQARELWQRVDRPNLLIKVPATLEGLPAITTLISEGISVNVTIIFSVTRYAEVLSAYNSGLEMRAAQGLDLSQIHSVASFFVSRVDTEIDARLQSNQDGLTLRGKAAIANARLAYQHFELVTRSQRWRDLHNRGANLQRPLWASTGVKDPAYDPGMYVTELVAANTVNTMPEQTLIAVRDSNAQIQESISSHYENSAQVINELAGFGIDIEEVAGKLESEGIEKFIKPWNTLIENVDKVARS